MTSALAAACGGVAAEPEAVPLLPEALMSHVPKDSRQVILVLSPAAESVPVRLWCLERVSEKGAWQTKMGPLPAVVGRNGLSWGRSDFTPDQAPKISPAWRIKHEGDGCSPAGVFALPFAFGSSDKTETAWLKLPYTQATPSLRGVDDPASLFYNRVVDETKLPDGGKKDWNSSEDMLRTGDDAYKWGVFIGHNWPGTVRGKGARGSCIFLHLWKDEKSGTAGCTALAEDSLKKIMAWLDPAAKPMLVQTVARLK